MADDFVITPGGKRHRSLVHEVGPDHVITPIRGELRALNTRTNEFLALDAVPPVSPPPAHGGWAAWAEWQNTTGQAIEELSTTWKVPAEPTQSDGQLLYLFNGLQDGANTRAILQPVLQWGDSPLGGAPAWAVASWYVLTDGHAYTSGLVPVQPGDTLVGVMRRMPANGARFSYTCEFVGIPGTKLSVQGVPELVYADQTLEVYGVQNCQQLPAIGTTAMTQIILTTSAGPAPVRWAVYSDLNVINCNQRAVVVDDSATAGEVDIYYR